MRSLSALIASRLQVLLLVAILPLAACKDDDKPDDPKPTANSLTLELQHNGPDDATPLRLNTTYRTATGFDYRLTKLDYYVSNVKLTRTDGTIWTEPASYHLVRVAGAPADNPTIELTNVPFGDYTSITFGVGIDATANHTGDQAGDLSPNNGMIWNWLTGYKFWVMEGDILPATGTSQNMQLHIGSDNNYQTQTLTFPTTATVRVDIAPEAHVFVNTNRVFGDPAQPATVLDLNSASARTIMSASPEATLVANNLRTLFSVEHVHNDKK
jgi:hypothetical protein